MLNVTAESELTMILSRCCERTFVVDADCRVHLLKAVVIDAALFILYIVDRSRVDGEELQSLRFKH
jgi:hypothetical protein